MPDELAETRSVVRHLAGQLIWLEHHVRTSAGLIAVAIDEASPALRNLARKADLAATSRAGMLPELQRSSPQAQVNRYDNLRRQRQQHLATAVTHSRILADCPTPRRTCRSLHRLPCCPNPGQPAR
jgi:hypothetical protein